MRNNILRVALACLISFPVLLSTAIPVFADEAPSRTSQDVEYVPGDTEHFRYWEPFTLPQRDLVSQPDRVLAHSSIKPGDTVADIGSGAGYYTFKIARKVGAKGKVFAVESMLPNDLQAYFDQQLGNDQVNPYQNVHLVNNTYDDSHLEANSIDVAFMCLTATLLVRKEETTTDLERHNLGLQKKMMRSVYKALKPGGKLVLIDLYRHLHEPMKRLSLTEEIGIYEAARSLGDVIANYERLGFHYIKDYDFLRNKEQEQRFADFRNLPVYSKLDVLGFVFTTPRFYMIFKKPER